MLNVLLQNATRDLVPLNLEHEYACTEEVCFCVRVGQVHSAHDPKSGAVSGVVKRVRVAGSITLTAMGTPGDRRTVPAQVSTVPEIASRIRRGLIVLTPVEEAVAVAEEPSADETTGDEPTGDEPTGDETAAPADQPTAEPVAAVEAASVTPTEAELVAPTEDPNAVSNPKAARRRGA